MSLGKEENQVKLLSSIRTLYEMGFKLFATEHTADFLLENKVKCTKVYKMQRSKKPNVSELLASGDLDLIINVPEKALARESEDGFVLRRKAVDLNIPLITNRQLAEAFVTAFHEIRDQKIVIKSWEEYRSQ